MEEDSDFEARALELCNKLKHDVRPCEHCYNAIMREEGVRQRQQLVSPMLVRGD